MQEINGFEITDDSGFIGIVNADKYNSFVDPDWRLSELMNRFVEEMNNESLIIWATGAENEWHVTFLNAPSEKKSFREFSKRIKVTDGRLFLTNFEDLTMAAQFDDAAIPSNHNSDLFIELENGSYNLTVRQMFDPDDYEIFDSIANHFEIVVAFADGLQADNIDKVYWLND